MSSKADWVKPLRARCRNEEEAIQFHQSRANLCEPVRDLFCTEVYQHTEHVFQDPNRVRGHVNTGIVDIDGDGIEAVELISAIFMGYPLTQPAAHPAVDPQHFRVLQENYQGAIAAENDQEREEHGDGLTGWMYSDVGGLWDPNRVRGKINTGILDIDGDGLETSEVVSAVFMGLPGGQPRGHPPTGREIFKGLQDSYRERVASEDEAEKHARLLDREEVAKMGHQHQHALHNLEEYPAPLFEEFQESHIEIVHKQKMESLEGVEAFNLMFSEAQKIDESDSLGCCTALPSSHSALQLPSTEATPFPFLTAKPVHQMDKSCAARMLSCA